MNDADHAFPGRRRRLLNSVVLAFRPSGRYIPNSETARPPHFGCAKTLDLADPLSREVGLPAVILAAAGHMYTVKQLSLACTMLALT